MVTRHVINTIITNILLLKIKVVESKSNPIFRKISSVAHRFNFRLQCSLHTRGGSNALLKGNPTVTVCVNDALICFGTFLLSPPDIIKIRLVLSAKPAL